MIYTLVAAALLGAAVAATSTWKVQQWRYDAKDKERIEAQQELDRNNRRVAQTASEGFENDRSKTDIKYRTREVEVEKIIERVVYRNICFDIDGLRQLNEAVRATGDTSKLENTLPATTKPE